MGDLVVTRRFTIPARELRESFAGSGGPGGQHVNKTESKVVLRWSPASSEALSESDRTWLLSRLQDRLTGDGDLLVTSERTRDQARNREDARGKLAETIRRALARPRPRKKTRPPRAAERRRLERKKRRSSLKKSRRGPKENE